MTVDQQLMTADELLRLHCDDADALVGHIVDALKSQSANLLSVEPQEPTLEDAFIALTEEENTRAWTR